jgi:hypothetical protein
MTQKHEANMLGVRGSYAMPLATDWTWHAGLGLYRVKARMETIGDFEASATTDGAWTTTMEKSTFMVQPFVGVGFKVTPSASLEFNLAYSNFKALDVAAQFNAKTAPSYGRVIPVFGEKSVGNVQLEITYVFHF